MVCQKPADIKDLCRSCYKKQYRVANKEKILAQESQQRKDNVVSLSENLKKYKYSPKGRFKYGASDAKRRGLEFTIEFEEYTKLIVQPCYYCEILPKASCGTGLDRIDNRIGYTRSNVLPCCGNCNVLRSDHFTSEEMKVAMRAILNYRNEKKYG